MTGIRRRSALAAGFAAVGTGKIIILLLAATTIVLSLLAAAPLGPSLKDAFARTLAGDHVLKNHPTFAPTDVFDFLREKAPAVSGMNAAAKWALLVALLQQILFAGGIVSVLGKPIPYGMPDFVAGVRRNAWHNVKCFLIFLLIAGATIGVWFAANHAIYQKFFEGLPPGASSTFFFRVAIVLGALLLYAVFSLLHDFARAARRSEDTIGAWSAYGHARRVLSGRWPRALGIFAFWLVFGGVLLLLAIGVEWSAPAISALAIALHILLQIAVLTIRPVIRVAAWGSYLALYDLAQPTLAPPAVVVTAPPESLASTSLALDETPLV
jgi:hypothetical protein